MKSLLSVELIVISNTVTNTGVKNAEETTEHFIDNEERTVILKQANELYTQEWNNKPENATLELANLAASFADTLPVGKKVSLLFVESLEFAVLAPEVTGEFEAAGDLGETEEGAAVLDEKKEDLN